MNREKAAKVLLYLGPFTLAGIILQGELVTHPVTTATAIFMMVPYTYIQFRRGLADSKLDTDTADTQG